MRAAWLAPLLMVASACGNPANPPPDGGPPLALDVLDSSQIGLHYGKSMELRVRYHADDAAAMPVAGGVVRFSIFGDPAGSTLSRDTATTDVNGIAAVTLTGGQAEAQFTVQATASNAPTAEFDVAVSKLGFVELDAQLTWSTPVTLRALLYDDKSCAALPPSPTLPAPSRAQSKSNATAATLSFVNLLSKPYALVGRAESAAGTLVGYGCVDVPAELAPPGSVSVVPIPLSATVPSPAGRFALASTLSPAPSTYATVMGVWNQLGGCPYGAAQDLLDAMGVTSHRDPVGSDGCRPASTTSLDKQLQDLLTAPPTGAANALPALAGDLDAITRSLTLKSTLTVTPASATTYTAEHALLGAGFEVSASLSKSYDLVALGEPVIDVKDVPFSDDGTTVTIGAHGFTLGFTTLWKQAFVDLSLTTRVMGLGSPPIPSLVTAIVAPATRAGKMSCNAVDDLVCTVTTGSGSCALATPCASALGPMAALLEAPFAPTSGIDLTLAGTATPVDSDGDLVVDMLNAGSWTATGLAPMSTFSGTKQ